MKLIYLTVLFCMILFAQAQVTGPYAQIEQMLKSGKTEVAEQALNKLLQEDRNQPDTFYYLGVIYLLRNDAEKAIEFFEEAIDLKDTDYRYYENLGDAYGLKAQQSNMFSAMFVIGDMRSNWEKAIELKPDLVTSRMRLFSFYLMAPGIAGGDDEKALKLAEEVLQLDSLRGYPLRARYFEKQKKLEQAEKDYLKAVRLDSTNGQLANLLAYFYLNQKKYAQAFTWFNRYVFLNPDQPNAYDSRGDYFTATAQYDSALAMYRKALSVDPEFQPSLFNSAKMLNKLNRKQEAQVAAKKYLAKYPKGNYANEAEDIAGE